ncbi:MAG: sulfotransferase family protein [Nocardioides sp.]|nr:sulfotransferase family protein [Nocardioides sp.]
MQPDSRTALVLVTGSGRSGTSSLAGTLKRLGLHIPQPEVEASETNPRGFYEPQWVIDFHKGYLKGLGIHNIDSRPGVERLVQELAETGEPGARLTDWLGEQPRDHPLVVKDPHAFWFAEVWRSSCAAADLDLRWLTALRHPAEVVGSRDLAYLQDRSDELRLVKETSNVAGWVHAALLTERAGRGGLRAFVRYGDLLDDWRTAMRPAAGQLELRDLDLAERPDHPVDDFLEPSMRRSKLTWDDIRVPGWLQEMAEEVWQLLERLVDAPADTEAQDRLDAIGSDYRARYVEAVALTFDHTQGENKVAARQARDAQRETVQDLRRKLQRLRAQHGS